MGERLLCPKVIFDTKTEIGNWAVNVEIPASAFTSAAVGEVITVVTSNLASDAQGSFKDGNWAEIADGTNYFDISGNFSLSITDDILGKLKDGGLKVSGKNYIIEKITLK